MANEKAQYQDEEEEEPWELFDRWVIRNPINHNEFLCFFRKSIYSKLYVEVTTIYRSSQYRQESKHVAEAFRNAYADLHDENWEIVRYTHSLSEITEKEAKTV